MSEWERNYEEEYCETGKVRFIWTLLGEPGGLHLWIKKSMFDEEYFGGVECHYRKAPAGREMTNDNCWLLNAPCYHDGSSLMAERIFIPMWEEDPKDHNRIFTKLEEVAKANLEEDNNDD